MLVVENNIYIMILLPYSFPRRDHVMMLLLITMQPGYGIFSYTRISIDAVILASETNAKTFLFFSRGNRFCMSYTPTCM